MTRIRCAVYTRKSSEEGLEQGFNSLHAQREACEAYVRSQASEGWALVGRDYDDGACSGGSLDRPALRRLRADIAARRLDVVVVYKVDRLTRSLFDFARLVEAFDAAGVSFVSVTQSFNTTTSMGRLTLNMLLSFAQFEREVTQERIRDKIAASKAKGMWMGGTPPIGYAPDGRSLRIIPEQAELVRRIFALYIEHRNVRRVAERLATEGVATPKRTSASGRSYGGRPLGRGQIYKLLANPVYVGEIAHKGARHPGRHAPIIDRATWDGAQATLAGAGHRHRARSNARVASPLAGRLVDDGGAPLVAAHATRRGVRYRYYVSRALQHGTRAGGASGLRIPAAEIEALVAAQLAHLLADPVALCARLETPLHGSCIAAAIQRGAGLAARLRADGDAGLMAACVERIVVGPERVSVALAPAAMLGALGMGGRDGEAAGAHEPASIRIDVSARLRRSGRAQRIVIAGDAPRPPRAPDPALVKALARAHRWWGMLRADPKLTIPTIARGEAVSDTYVDRILRLAFLAPGLTEALLAGAQPAATDLARLTARPLPLAWSDQEAQLGA